MASGDTLCVFLPQDNLPPATNYATVDLRNGHLVLDFDAATEEAAYFAGVLPRNYVGGGLTVSVRWMATTAITGAVTWGGSIERNHEAGDDLDADSFAAEQTANEAAPATSGILQYTNLTFTAGVNMDSLAVGESFRLKLARKVLDAGDTMAGDAEVVGVEIKET